METKLASAHSGGMETKLAWLAGIVDGEGYVAIRVRDNRNRTANVSHPQDSFRHSFLCFLRIGSTAPVMALSVATILGELGICYSLPKPASYSNTSRPYHIIEVRKQRDLLRLCDLLSTYSVVKKQELNIVIRYLTKSLASSRYRVDTEDLTLALQLAELHDLSGGGKGVSQRGTLRQRIAMLIPSQAEDELASSGVRRDYTEGALDDI